MSHKARMALEREANDIMKTIPKILGSVDDLASPMVGTLEELERDMLALDVTTKNWRLASSMGLNPRANRLIKNMRNSVSSLRAMILLLSLDAQSRMASEQQKTLRTLIEIGQQNVSISLRLGRSLQELTDQLGGNAFPEKLDRVEEFRNVCGTEHSSGRCLSAVPEEAGSSETAEDGQGDPKQNITEDDLRVCIAAMGGVSLTSTENVSASLDLKCQTELVSKKFLERMGFMLFTNDILKPRIYPGYGGNLVRPTREIEIRWRPAWASKVLETTFLVDDSLTQVDMVLGKSYADLEGIFNKENTEVYALRFPWVSRQGDEARKIAAQTHREESKRLEAQQRIQDLEARRQRLLAAASSTLPSSAAPSVLSGSSNNPVVTPWTPPTTGTSTTSVPIVRARSL